MIATVALLLAVATGTAASDVQTIEGLRASNNHALTAHDAKAFSRLWAPHFVLIESDGTTWNDSAKLLRSYENDEFKNRAFLTYDRRPDLVTISTDGKHAAEQGHWRALYRDARPAPSGTYLASWVLTPSGWRVQWEAYIRLDSGAKP